MDPVKRPYIIDGQDALISILTDNLRVISRRDLVMMVQGAIDANRIRLFDLRRRYNQTPKNNSYHRITLEHDMTKLENITHYEVEYDGTIINTNDDAVLARAGKLQLSPETFERGAISTPQESEEMVHLIETADYRRRRPTMTQRRDGAPDVPDAYGHYLYSLPNKGSHYGWERDQLIRAIINSGLAIKVEPYQSVASRTNGSTYYIDHAIPFSSLGLRSLNHPGQQYLPGLFGQWIDLPAVYYETLYRLIFNGNIDPRLLDWSNLCANNLVSEEYMRGRLIQDFGYIENQLPRQRAQLCDLYHQAQQQHHTQFKLTQNEIPTWAITVRDQPGSRWLQPTQWNNDIIAPSIQEPELWQYLENNCDLDSLPFDRVAQYAIELGIPVLPADTKVTLCGKIRRTITILRQAK